MAGAYLSIFGRAHAGKRLLNPGIPHPGGNGTVREFGGKKPSAVGADGGRDQAADILFSKISLDFPVKKSPLAFSLSGNFAGFPGNEKSVGGCVRCNQEILPPGGIGAPLGMQKPFRSEGRGKAGPPAFFRLLQNNGILQQPF